MKLLLHTPESKNQLSNYYRRAFNQAVELFIVTPTRPIGFGLCEGYGKIQPRFA